jgi:hypothetical protein
MLFSNVVPLGCCRVSLLISETAFFIIYPNLSYIAAVIFDECFSPTLSQQFQHHSPTMAKTIHLLEILHDTKFFITIQITIHSNHNLKKKN